MKQLKCPGDDRAVLCLLLTRGILLVGVLIDHVSDGFMVLQIKSNQVLSGIHPINSSAGFSSLARCWNWGLLMMVSLSKVVLDVVFAWSSFVQWRHMQNFHFGFCLVVLV